MIITKEAAKRLGISQRRVEILLRQGQIKGTKIGDRWILEEEDLVYQRKPRDGYRPRKEKSNES